MNHYPNLFSPCRIGRHLIKNRIIMTAMSTNQGEHDGWLSQTLINYIVTRARGGAGLIILEPAIPDPSLGKPISDHMLRMDDIKYLKGYHELAERVHGYDAKIMVQLVLSGIDYFEEPFDPVGYGTRICASYSTDALKTVIERFVASAIYLKMAGIDGVEVESGGGYFINQFLSNLSNKRTDEFGGDLEGRANLMLSIIKGIRRACGDDFIISMRLASNDSIEGGLTQEDGAKLASMCEKAGANLINVTPGFSLTDEAMETEAWPDGHRVHFSEYIKRHINILVTANGKLRTPEMCESIIGKGEADFVALGRSLLCDPNWPNKAKEAKAEEIRPCISCLSCLDTLVNHGTIRCALNPYVGYESTYDESNTPSAVVRKKVAVIGGGPCGMQAAITAAKRGHKVILFEKAKKLGGQLNIAAVPPNKQTIHTATEWFISELKRNKVAVRLGTEATTENISKLGCDVALICAGSIPIHPPIEGIEMAVESWDILSGKFPPPNEKRIVIVGGGTVGCETAQYLAQSGNKVTVLEMVGDYAAGLELFHKELLGFMMEQSGIKLELNATVKKIKDYVVMCTDSNGKDVSYESDLTIVSTGQKSIGGDLFRELEGKGIKTFIIGDAKSVGKIRNATREGFDIAYSI